MVYKNTTINTINFFLMLLKMAFKSALTSRSAFIMQMSAMIINDLVWLFMWLALFNKHPNIHDWQFNDVILMQGILLFSHGTFAIFMCGLDDLPKFINNGNLDNFLIFPKNLLLTISCSKVKASGLGSIFAGIVMFSLTTYATWHNLPLILASIICAIIVFFAFRLITITFSFWSQNIENLGIHVFYALLALSSQPASELKASNA